MQSQTTITTIPAALYASRFSPTHQMDEFYFTAEEEHLKLNDGDYSYDTNAIFNYENENTTATPPFFHPCFLPDVDIADHDFEAADNFHSDANNNTDFEGQFDFDMDFNCNFNRHTIENDEIDCINTFLQVPASSPVLNKSPTQHNQPTSPNSNPSPSPAINSNSNSNPKPIVERCTQLMTRKRFDLNSPKFKEQVREIHNDDIKLVYDPKSESFVAYDRVREIRYILNLASSPESGLEVYHVLSKREYRRRAIARWNSKKLHAKRRDRSKDVYSTSTGRRLTYKCRSDFAHGRSRSSSGRFVSK